MMKLQISLCLLSDATFGRGEGLAGVVDAEIEQDADGLPYLRGRALKGLLVEECANLMYALARTHQPAHDRFAAVAQSLFGRAGSTDSDSALLKVGAARLPAELRVAVRYEIKNHGLTAAEALDALTALRRQTAVDEQTHAPEKNSLRSSRVLLRATVLQALLEGHADLDTDEAKALLAACVLGLRRAGTGRNRGRGRLRARLHDEQGADVTERYFRFFAQAVTLLPVAETTAITAEEVE